MSPTLPPSPSPRAQRVAVHTDVGAYTDRAQCLAEKGLRERSENVTHLGGGVWETRWCATPAEAAQFFSSQWRGDDRTPQRSLTRGDITPTLTATRRSPGPPTPPLLCMRRVFYLPKRVKVAARTPPQHDPAPPFRMRRCLSHTSVDDAAAPAIDRYGYPHAAASGELSGFVRAGSAPAPGGSERDNHPSPAAPPSPPPARRVVLHAPPPSSAAASPAHHPPLPFISPLSSSGCGSCASAGTAPSTAGLSCSSSLSGSVATSIGNPVDHPAATHAHAHAAANVEIWFNGVCVGPPGEYDVTDTAPSLAAAASPSHACTDTGMGLSLGVGGQAATATTASHSTREDSRDASGNRLPPAPPSHSTSASSIATVAMGGVGDGPLLLDVSDDDNDNDIIIARNTRRTPTIIPGPAVSGADVIRVTAGVEESTFDENDDGEEVHVVGVCSAGGGPVDKSILHAARRSISVTTLPSEASIHDYHWSCDIDKHLRDPSHPAAVTVDVDLRRHAPGWGSYVCAAELYAPPPPSPPSCTAGVARRSSAACALGVSPVKTSPQIHGTAKRRAPEREARQAHAHSPPLPPGWRTTPRTTPVATPMSTPVGTPASRTPKSVAAGGGGGSGETSAASQDIVARSSTEVTLNDAPHPQKCRLQLNVPHPLLWSAEVPYLYTLVLVVAPVSCGEGGMDGAEDRVPAAARVRRERRGDPMVQHCASSPAAAAAPPPLIQVESIQIGLRSVTVDDGVLQINGAAVVLKAADEMGLHAAHHAPHATTAPDAPSPPASGSVATTTAGSTPLATPESVGLPCCLVPDGRYDALLPAAALSMPALTHPVVTDHSTGSHGYELDHPQPCTSDADSLSRYRSLPQSARGGSAGVVAVPERKRPVELGEYGPVDEFVAGEEDGPAVDDDDDHKNATPLDDVALESADDALAHALESRVLAAKRVGCNALRLHPDTPRCPLLYRLCDELGLYVVDEVGAAAEAALPPPPMGVPASASASASASHAAAYAARLTDMYYLHRNYTCVVGWSLKDGARAGSTATEAYGSHHDAMAGWLRTHDPNRFLAFPLSSESSAAAVGAAGELAVGGVAGGSYGGLTPVAAGAAAGACADAPKTPPRRPLRPRSNSRTPKRNSAKSPPPQHSRRRAPLAVPDDVVCGMFYLTVPVPADSSQ